MSSGDSLASFAGTGTCGGTWSGVKMLVLSRSADMKELWNTLCLPTCPPFLEGFIRPKQRAWQSQVL